MEHVIEPATTTGLVIFGLHMIVYAIWMYLIFNRTMIQDIK